MRKRDAFLLLLPWGLLLAFTLVMVILCTKPRDVSGEGVPAQTYTPHVDIAKYDMWAPPDSSYICDRDGNCAWLPDGTILLTPLPETVPPNPNFY